MAAAIGAPTASLFARGWEIHTVEVHNLPVVDLTATDALDHEAVGIGLGEREARRTTRSGFDAGIRVGHGAGIDI